MSKGFQVDTEYRGYVYLGHTHGMYEPRDGGDKRPYFNMYVISPVSTYSSEDYQASGFKAEKKKCLNAEVWQGFNPGDKVRLFFDDKGRVQASALDS